MKKNAIYAQSGGVTAVINASACGVITTCRDSEKIEVLYAAQNGILGILNENLIDTSFETKEDIALLRYTPGGAFGSCRYKLKNLEQNRKEYERLIEVFSAYNIGYFFYNGGNDSADTCLKVSLIAQELNYPINAIHIPKTIDNDLVVTDNCPGYGSVAKYVATSILEAGFDLNSMFATSTKVFILEVMGRNAGWIVASCGLASKEIGQPPHIILFPEIQFDLKRFLKKVLDTVSKYGYCVIAVSEGIKIQESDIIDNLRGVDAFGHRQLGGISATLANIISNELKLKCHFAIADYLQRSARHLASRTDIDQAYYLGAVAVKLALNKHNAIMPYIKRISQEPYLWEIDYVHLNEVANKEKFLPRDFIDEEGFHITKKCREYIEPLIRGEDYPLYVNGLPHYVKLKNQLVVKKLFEFSSVV